MSIRQQLSMFVPPANAFIIEQVRQRYNPLQAALIAAHVTLCREDELPDMEQIRRNLQQLQQTPVTIHFGPPTRFDDGKGVLLPAVASTATFQQLRNAVFQNVIEFPRPHQPHITLLHPRNTTCTDAIFEQLLLTRFPTTISFSSVSIIEQKDQQPWRVLETYTLLQPIQ